MGFLVTAPEACLQGAELVLETLEVVFNSWSFRKVDKSILQDMLKSLLFGVVVLVLVGCAGSPQSQLSFISQLAESRYGFYRMDGDGSNAKAVILEAANIDYLQPSPDGRYIVVRYKDKGEYYLRDLGSEDEGVCLTCGVDEYATPIFSPAGDKIIFSAQPGLYILSTEALEVKQISSVPEPLEISWSRDGEFIAFVAGSGPGRWRDVYRTGSDGADLITLAQGTGNDPVLFDPEWSPTGERIAFFILDNGLHVMAVNHDGSQLIRVADWQVTSNVELFEQVLGWGELRWSPDGSQLAFLSASAPDNRDVFVVNVDGSGLTNVSNLPGRDSAITWSPAGNRLAFVSESAAGESDIFSVNADGSNLRNLTDSPGSDRELVWSPDGGQMAFRTNRDGNWEIYVMNADGKCI